TLTGKYGEEGDKLLFKVLNNGDFLAKADEKALAEKDSNAVIASISKRGLRYDLTVPFARFVVMHQNEFSFPFKRYAIAPVWRADRPQKGRYQEFYQCDVDVVGSDSLMYEAELMRIYDEVFANLGLEVEIKFNNRKVLAGMAEVAGCSDKFMEMTIAIDKLDKVGADGVKKEMTEKGISVDAVVTILNILEIKDLPTLREAMTGSETGTKGIEELEEVFAYLEGINLSNTTSFDITLARGLNYYTGGIFEVKAKGVEMGSIGGGGRYDDLTGVFGLQGVSGVGVSFGAERIYDVMEELNLFPEDNPENLQLLLLAMDKEAHKYAFTMLDQIRKADINADLYPDPVKLKKQMKYANDRNVPYVIIIGTSEMESGTFSLKNMKSGEQENVNLAAVIDKLKA
ncbi:MAG: histidine--tRNA ligase, partial [Saprospiraceae bacterium]|nr:histidine--tRNA ligase [Saprospiraceae bacterium]